MFANPAPTLFYFIFSLVYVLFVQYNCSCLFLPAALQPRAVHAELSSTSLKTRQSSEGTGAANRTLKAEREIFDEKIKCVFPSVFSNTEYD